MNTQTETRTFVLPAYWASYLVNGDSSGMQAADYKACNAFLVKEDVLRDWFIDCGDSYFAKDNDANTGLAGDVCVFTAICPKRPAPIPPDHPYLVWDNQTGKTVYQTTYRNRKRARSYADRMDLAYGAVRYIPGLLTQHFPPKQTVLRAYGLDNFPGVRKELFGDETD